MRKLLTGLITAALIISCATFSASARHGCRAADTVCGGFRAGCGPAACLSQQRVRAHHCVDADGDGICDNYDPNRCPGGGFVDADGDGVCDNYDPDNCPGGGNGGYVDADGDGTCDNYDPENCPGNGTGGGYGCGSGMGSGSGGHHGGGHHGGRHC